VLRARFVSLVVLGAIAAAASAREADSTRRWREDLSYFASEAPRRHPNFYHHLTRDEFSAMVRDLSNRVPAAQDYEIIVGLARITAALGPRDGHSRVNLLSPDLHFHTLPLNFHMYSDGIFVRAASKQYADVVGARLIAIGRLSAEDAFRAVLGVTAGDNAMSGRADAERLLSVSEVLRAVGAAAGSPAESVPVEVEIAGGKRTVDVMPTASLAAVEWVDVRSAKPAFYRRWASHDPFARHTADKNFWFEYLPDPQLLYVNFSVVGDAPDESVAAFFDKVFAFADGHKVEKFVLDIRENGGGNNYLNRPVLYGLIRHEQTLGRRGTLFVMIGRETFSAAQNLANVLDLHTNAIFVGEPTGGAPNHFGDSLRLTLPNSRVPVNLSSVWWQDMDPRDQRPWIAPDIAAERASIDDREGSDPGLQAIIDYKPAVPLSDRVRQALLEGGKEKASTVVAAWRAEPAHKYATGESELSDLGLQLFGEKRINDAVGVFELNAAVNGDSWRAHHNLGRAYAAAEKIDAARAEFMRALAIRRDAPETLSAIDRLDAGRQNVPR